MQAIINAWLSSLLLLSVWFGGKGNGILVVQGLSFDQCQPDDSLFKHTNIELEVNTNTTGWIHRFQVTSPQQCVNKCHHMRPQCKSAVFNVDSKTCLIFNINRYSVKAKFRVNATFKYFERYECPSSNFQQQQVITNTDDIRYKKFVAIQKKAKSCKDLYDRFNYRKDGLYAVNVGEVSDGFLRPIQCDMTTRGGGWTVIEQRMDGSVSFEVDWNNFKSGFGNFHGDYYYGNENWHMLTKGPTVKHELYFILETAGGAVSEQSYDDVSIGPESDRYRLALGTYQYISGVDLRVDGDKFKSKNNGKEFATRDLDTTDSQCVDTFTGGFWYGHQCGNVNLHGIWGTDVNKGIKWKGMTGNQGSDSFRKVTILIR